MEDEMKLRVEIDGIDTFMRFVGEADELHCREAELHLRAMVASELVDPDLADLLENDSIGG